MTEAKLPDITILADIVDNFGDIGVAWRLCRNIFRNQAAGENPKQNISIRLVTNSLSSFAKINNQINPDLPFQECKCENGTIKVYDWTDYDFCYRTFTDNPPEVILEMFQCGQPDWLEKILFEDRVDYKVHIIMIDYLSAEPWVDDFHCLKSLTRTALVPKVNFMPGFTNKTGGLLLTSNIQKELNKKDFPNHDYQLKNILFFAYNRDWAPVIRAMNRVFTPETTVKVAGGAGQDSILEACKKENSSFKAEKLSFMNQNEWDQNMLSMDFMIIRGEDSMAQGCLSGVPFIWQAYPQQNDFQTVKVEALLERMKPFFGEEFIFVKNAWSQMNSYESSAENPELENTVYEFLKNIELLKTGFRSFALSLRSNGDLAENLMTFIEKNIKIEK
ncbi:MAG: elongation factor P maturation arginine rhamnosyltransferase EarP [Treponema sp.]|nr:elongation factor P maturation arginine rhamnosyltransferase EarP [Treponema sp.]